jgi:hypothetical protein
MYWLSTPSLSASTPLWRLIKEILPFQNLLLHVSLGTALQVPLTELPERERERERDSLFPETTFILLPKSPVKEPPSRFPGGAPVERDARFQSLLLHISRVSNKRVSC